MTLLSNALKTTACRFAIAALLAGALPAQNTGSLFGTVTDSSGAAIAGAGVSATHVQTGLVRSTTANQNGDWNLASLPVGTFQVRITSQGFKEGILSDVLLQVSENRRVDFALEVGSVSERVEVQAQAAQVETRTGTIAEVIDSKRIAELPLNGRNPVQLQLLVPGVGRRGPRDQQQNETVSVNGSAQRGNNYALDGGDNHDPFFNTPAPFPNPDALQEFSIETNGYGADRGRNAGIFVSAVTKSGSNQIHGTAFWYLRNDKLNARDFFAVTVPPFKRNQFGGTVGGPIRRDQTFFFVSYQGTEERSAPGVTTALVPDRAMRGGDFSQLNRVIRDPSGGVFPGGVIPVSRLYAPANKFLDTFIPLPNLPGNLLSFASKERVSDKQFVTKVDHQLTAAHRLSFRLLWNDNDSQQAVGTIPDLLASIPYKNWNGTASDSWIVSPTVVNTLTFTIQNIERDQQAITPGNVGWRDFGTGIVRAHREDTVAATDTNVIGYWYAFTRHPLYQQRYFYHVRNETAATVASHFLKFGGEWRYNILDRRERFRGDPGIVFRGQITGDAMADFMLGRPDSIAQNSGNEFFPVGHEVSLFFQDDWKVNRRLTLNLGLRWEPFIPPPDRRGTGAMFRPGEQSTFFPRAPLGLVYWGRDAVVPEKYGVGNIWNNWSPRLGFAFDPTGSGKTSIRGAYGLFYAVRALQQTLGNAGPGYVLATNINPVPGGMADPYQTVGGNPYPFTPPETEQERRSFEFIRPVSVAGFGPDFRNGIVQQWNLNIQRQVGSDWIFTAAYVANAGRYLESTTEANPGVFGRPGNLQQRRVYPVFASIGQATSEADSTFHSMQLTANRRFAKGLTLLASYTWGKNLDTSATPQDGRDFRREKALSANNIAHRFVASFIWEIPRARVNPALGLLINGWELNGIISAESGLPFNVVSGRDNSGTGVNADRPDLIGNPYLDTGRPKAERILKYFDPAAFAQNAPGTFGNAGRNLIVGPGASSVDLGIVKTFRIKEQHRVRFRAESFNTMNRTNLDNPNGNLLSPQVGRITSAGSPRVFQFALRYEF
jgi:hypothetical protein